MRNIVIIQIIGKKIGLNINLNELISSELIDDTKTNKTIEMIPEEKPKTKLNVSILILISCEALVVKIRKNHSDIPF